MLQIKINMKALEEKIINEGKVLDGNVLKVGSFLNQRIDAEFVMEMGKEIARLYKDEDITKIFTIESSGIAIAMAAALELKVPFVFAKKNKSANVGDDVYSSTVHSFTHNNTYDAVVSKEFISKEDNILIIDDFLARGNALTGLIDMVNQSGASLKGVAIAIEKGFQGGGDEFREKGIRIESLAIIDEMNDGVIKFRPQPYAN